MMMIQPIIKIISAKVIRDKIVLSLTIVKSFQWVESGLAGVYTIPFSRSSPVW